MTASKTPEGILFIESDCIRDDLLRVYQTLGESMTGLGVLVRTLCGPGVEQSELKNYSFPNLEFWSDLRNESKFQLGIKQFFSLNWFSQYLASISRATHPHTAFVMQSETAIFREYLISTRPNFLLGIKFSSFVPCVFAAKSLKIPVYAIQHTEYDRSYLESRPHEWPARNIFSWSDKSKALHEAQYRGKGYRFIPGGPIWDMRIRDSKPEKIPGLLTIVESEEEVFSKSLIDNVVEMIGRRNVEIKPHPYSLKLGVSRAYNVFPSLCNSSNFWDSVPELALSLGSSSTFELIHLGVPVITIVPSAFEADYFPKAGSFENTPAGIRQALHATKELLASQEKRERLLRNQQHENAGLSLSSSLTLSRIMATLIDETFPK